jgi:hypothetical protein
MKSFSEWNADNAGPSREWRPGGAPTTDEDLHIRLETIGLSVVVFSAVPSTERTVLRNKWLSVCNWVKRTSQGRILKVRRSDRTRGSSMWGIRIRGRNTSKPLWWTGNQWKSSLPETGFSEVSRRGTHKSAVETPRKPASQLMNGWKSAW